MELNESHVHAPIGAMLDGGLPWEAPFSHPSTLGVGKVCAGPEPFTIQASSGHRQASRRIQRDANGRRVTPLARVSLDKSHSIIWGNSGAEPAPLLTATHEAHSSGILEYKAVNALGDEICATRCAHDHHCSRLLRVFACNIPFGLRRMPSASGRLITERCFCFTICRWQRHRRQAQAKCATCDRCFNTPFYR
jgi:hypothetical protein